MAFRVGGLGKAYDDAQIEAIRLRSFASAFQAQLATETVSANSVITALQRVVASIVTFDRVAAVPGISVYAQNEENDPAYNVAAEFTAMRTEAIGVRDWILTNFPTATSGEILKDTLEVDGSVTVRQFTSVQTAGLQSALGLLVATIGV